MLKAKLLLLEENKQLLTTFTKKGGVHANKKGQRAYCDVSLYYFSVVRTDIGNSAV